MEGGAGEKESVPDKRGEREISSLFPFPAPLVPLLAGKDDDEGTKEGRAGSSHSNGNSNTNTPKVVRARCGHSASA